jgi:hypothetical protein
MVRDKRDKPVMLDQKQEALPIQRARTLFANELRVL